MMEPNYAQQQALLQLQKSKQEGKTKALVVLPSGVGKTHLSAFETKGFSGRILYLVHRNEILDQAKNVFKTIHNLHERDIGTCNQYYKQLERKYLFATIQSISIKKTLEQLTPTDFDYIILDEWHHTAARSYQKILNYFKPKQLLNSSLILFHLFLLPIYSFVHPF